MTNPATALADGGRLLLDGGLGQELVRRGVDTSHGLWSAQALLDSPETVTAAHRDFVDAGADVITTNTYATTQRRFPDRARWRTLNETAARLARDAASAAGRSVYIAGSLPPLNGSYRPDRVGDPAELEREYREQAGVLAAHVDLLLCETMSTAGEAAAAARGAVAAGLPVWVSWTLLDDGSGNLRSGETIAAAVDAIGDLPVQAFLVNCSIPESVGAAVAELRTLANRPYGAYANAFEPIAVGVDDGRDLPNARSDLDPPTYAARVNDWLAAGARIVGGCCEVGPAHIAELKQRFFAGTAEPAE